MSSVKHVPDGSVTPDSRRWKWGASGLLACAYVAAFGVPTIWAFRVLLDPGTLAEAGEPSPAEVAMYVGVVPLTVAVLFVAHRFLRLSWDELGVRTPRPAPLGPIGVMSLSCVILALAGGAMLTAILQFSPAYVPPSSPGEQVSTAVVLSGVLSAVGEEILLLALPMALTEKLRWSRSNQLLLLLALRLPFHLYYGPLALVLVIVWIPAWWWLYRRVGSVWPFLAAHLFYNLVVLGGGYFSGPVRTGVVLAAIAMGILGLATAVTWVVRSRRRGAEVGDS
jgi:Type II CAAX prenyl endopeptidase Rce1-like